MILKKLIFTGLLSLSLNSFALDGDYVRETVNQPQDGIENDVTGTIKSTTGQRELTLIDVSCDGQVLYHGVILLEDNGKQFDIYYLPNKLLFDESRCSYSTLPYKILQ